MSLLCYTVKPISAISFLGKMCSPRIFGTFDELGNA